MRFAKIIFGIATLLGLAGCAMYYFQPGSPGYYGLIANSFSLQLVFVFIAYSPQRFRIMMIPAAIGKLLWVPTLIFLHFFGHLTLAELLYSGIPHGVLGILMLVAYVVTPSPARLEPTRTAVTVA
jgi:hypothetical protein